MTPVHRVTIHHEGAGKPSDNVARFLDTDNYSIGIGVTRFSVRRSPYDSFVTDGQHGERSLQVCLSGDRTYAPVTDSDLHLITEAVRAARAHGWVGAGALIAPHRGSAQTACPGNRTMDRWSAVVLAVNSGLGGAYGNAAPSPHFPAPQPLPHPTVRTGSRGGAVVTLQWKMLHACGQRLAIDGIFGGATYRGVVNVQRFFRLPVDGVCGPRTWGVIDYAAALKGLR